MLVCAPAGIRQDGGAGATGPGAARRPVAWLSLDAGDNDPARFWRHVARRGGPGAARASPSGCCRCSARRRRRQFEGLVTGADQRTGRAARRRRGGAGPGRLPPDRGPGGPRVADASCSSICRRGCRWCWPAGPTRRCRWRGCGPAVSWRSCAPPTCGSPRTRPRRCCARRRSRSSALSDAAVAALAARTEGWAAGLQLAGLSLRGQADVAGFVAAFSGSHRYVLDYLTEEVLERLDEQVREVPAGDLGAGAAVRAAVRRGDRPDRWPGDAGGARAGQPVPGAAG